MDRYDWLLFLHVLAGFALIASMVIFATLLLTVRSASSPADSPLLRISGLATGLWQVGGLGTLVFGIWLAIDSPPPIDYDFFDGWILAALVLWVISGGAGGQVVGAYSAARGGEDVSGMRSPRFTSQNVVMMLAAALMLIDMIFKPGA